MDAVGAVALCHQYFDESLVYFLSVRARCRHILTQIITSLYVFPTQQTTKVASRRFERFSDSSLTFRAF